MTYGSILAAAPVLQKLVGQNLHLRQAYMLTRIVKKINEELEFFNLKRNEIAESDRSDEDKIKMMNELLNLEIDWIIGPLELNLDDDIRISAADLDSAKGIIEIC